MGNSSFALGGMCHYPWGQPQLVAKVQELESWKGIKSKIIALYYIGYYFD